MSAFILSTILLVSPAPSFSTSSAQPPSLVEPESGAWAVVHAGELWVCWRPGPDCFERVVFDDDGRSRDDRFVEDEEAEEIVDELGSALELGPDDWRMGFWAGQSLWIEREEQRWRVLAGQRRAQVVDEPSPLRLVRVAPAACGPDALVPAVIGGRLSWRDAPRCTEPEGPKTMCVTRAGPRVRRPTPVRLRASVEIADTRAWTAGGAAELAPPIDTRRLSSGIEVSFVVELGFDWQRRVADRRAAAMIARRAQARLRELPTVQPGPRADAEREALAAIVCEGGQR